MFLPKLDFVPSLYAPQLLITVEYKNKSPNTAIDLHNDFTLYVNVEIDLDICWSVFSSHPLSTQVYTLTLTSLF